jgi:hypothetical protein
MRFLVLITLIIIANGCSTFSQAVNDKNIMKLKDGMSSDEIIKMFGSPHKVRDTTCGGNSPWNCIIWQYEDEWSGKEATFYFRKENGKKVLNSYDIEK